MKTKKKILIAAFGLLFLLMAAGAGWAAPITGFNTRPVTIGTTPGSEKSLQTMLDEIFGLNQINAATDQKTSGVWQAATLPPNEVFPVLKFEESGAAQTHRFGIWTAFDTNGPIVTAEIFSGAEGPGTIGLLQWTDMDTVKVTVGGNVKGTYDGIRSDWFGFYYDFIYNNTNLRLYTYDELNTASPMDGRKAAALAYTKTNAAWLIAFDDLQVDLDYNDFVVKVESIDPVPIPGAVLLLGAGLARLAAYARRRREE